MVKILATSCLLAAQLLLAGCGQTTIARFADLDRDHDGRISLQEASGDVELRRVFAKADADGNGELSAIEYLDAVHGS